MSERTLTRCRTCGAAIFFVWTPGNKLLPVDADPVADGNVVVEGDGGEVLGPLTLAALPVGTLRYRSHFATCPYADEHRRGKE